MMADQRWIKPFQTCLNLICPQSCVHFIGSKVFRRRSIRKIAISLLFLIPFMYFQLTFPVRYLFKHSNIRQACIIPQLDPYDPSIMKFVWDPEPLLCDRVPSLMYVDTGGILQLNTSAASYYDIDISKLKCEYRICSRHLDDDHVTFSSAVTFTPPVYVNSDFFSVACSDVHGKTVYERLLTNIVSIKPQSKKSILQESENNLSVVLFGLDSVSRSCAIRKLPKTFRFLTETLGSYDFKGHMKVGENTLPNLVPLYTGRRAWSDEFPVTDYAHQPFDSFPFIWKNFSDAGYVTMYAEDMAEISTFNYLTKGFIHPPTDHYMRPYWIAIADQVRYKLGYVLRYFENKNINLQKSSAMCYGDTPHHVTQVDYLKRFIQKYSGKRKFALSFLTEIAHEYPNFLSYGDEVFLEFFRWMKASGELENTVLIFFSDHGARIDEIRNTFVGRIEERMPVVIVYIPEHIREKFPALHKNMQLNTKRLSTNFDLHQTMLDIVHGSFENPSTSYFVDRARGISLFRPLPESRSCADAWIPEDYCACYTSSPVNVSTNQIVSMVAKEMVENLNSRLYSEPKCVELELFSVQEAEQINHGLQHSRTENTGISLFQFFKPEEKSTLRFLVVIETVPGHAIFEATYDFDNSQGNGRLVGDIVRVNKYGSQGNCISDKRLRPLCYCA